jgi:two-component system nitrogen regulation response regulator NtrX
VSGDILIVDDEADIRELVAGILEDEGYSTRLAGNADEALQAIEERRPNLVFLDIWMQGSRLDGMQLLDVVRSSYPELPVVMISGHGTIDTAVNAIKTGAFDFIEKPFKSDRLLHVAMRALETTALKREITELRQTSGIEYTLVGSSPEMNTLRTQIDRLAPTNSRVMILGASGCGKELVARAIHTKSRRAAGPFVVLNAARRKC